jgi:hypothetical protein
MNPAAVGKLPVDVAPRINVVAQIVITMTKDGVVRVDGPSNQAIMCYGLLKEAEYQINELRLRMERGPL